MRVRFYERESVPFVRRRRIYIPPPSGGITGSITVTEGGDTASASAAVKIASSAVLVEASDLAAAAVSVRVTGSAAIAEAKDTGAIVGRLRVTLSGAAVEGADGIAIAARARIAITSVSVERSDTATALMHRVILVDQPRYRTRVHYPNRNSMRRYPNRALVVRRAA